jgi:hypothetical protein
MANEWRKVHYCDSARNVIMQAAQFLFLLAGTSRLTVTSYPAIRLVVTDDIGHLIDDREPA